MIKNNIVIHITNNNIYIKKKEEIIKEENQYIDNQKIKQKTVIDGKVYNYTHFLNLMNQLVKKYKLNNSIFNNDIVVVTNSFITPLEEYSIKSIFKSLSFNKITIYKETKVFKRIIDNKKILLNINDSYAEIFYYDEKLVDKKRVKRDTFFSSKHYLKSITDIISEIILSTKERKPLLVAYGNKKEIKKIGDIIEKKFKVKISSFENESQLIDYL